MAQSYNVDNLAKLGGLQTLAQRTKTELDALDTKYAGSFRSLSVSGNTVSFFASNDGSGSAVATFDFPEEIFLQQTGTEIVDNFTFSQLTYPGATNPNLDGKTVLVLAVRGDANNPTVKYSFVDMYKVMSSAVSSYVAGDNSISINNYQIQVKISASANNAITLKNDGLHVDISDKADKVSNATANNLAKLDANGNLADSGAGIAADSDVTAMVTNVFGAQS